MENGTGWTTAARVLTAVCTMLLTVSAAPRDAAAETATAPGRVRSADHTLASLIDQAQVVVVGLRSDTVVSELRRRSRSDHFVLDLVKLPDPEALRGIYRGVCW